MAVCLAPWMYTLQGSEFAASNPFGGYLRNSVSDDDLADFNSAKVLLIWMVTRVWRHLWVTPASLSHLRIYSVTDISAVLAHKRAPVGLHFSRRGLLLRRAIRPGTPYHDAPTAISAIGLSAFSIRRIGQCHHTWNRPRSKRYRCCDHGSSPRTRR